MASTAVESSEFTIAKAVSKSDISSSTTTNEMKDIASLSKEQGDNEMSTTSGNADKLVIEMKGKMPNLALPSGWIGVNHDSGGIVYLHKDSRVVTWSRPYCIGKGSLRKHKVPVAAIPCLHQLSALQQDGSLKRKLTPSKNSILLPSKHPRISSNETQCHKTILSLAPREEKVCKATEHTDMQMAKENDAQCSTTGVWPSTSNFEEESDNLSLETESFGCVEEFKDSETFCSAPKSDEIGSTCNTNSVEHLETTQLHDYLGQIFSFRALSNGTASRPLLNDGTYQVAEELPEELQCLPHLSKSSELNQSTAEARLAAGKTPVSLLNEYCYGVMKKKVNYLETDPVDEEFSMEIEIDGVKYGNGKGMSKKVAKQEAAKMTLQILFPEKFSKFMEFEVSEDAIQVIDELDIEDSRVDDCTRALGLPSPSEILHDCLKRNHANLSDIDFKLIPGTKHNPHTYKMTYRNYKAKGLCVNRKVGRQLASQSILKQIHPELEKWGQIIKMYCQMPTSLIKDTNKITEDKEISRMSYNGEDVLKRLKDEMRKLKLANCALSNGFCH
eukprot:gene13946-15402_t